MIKQPNWWKKNDKTTKMGKKKTGFCGVWKKKLFQLEGIWKKMINQPRENFFFFFFFLVSFEVNIFSMRFPLFMEIVLVFDALSLVKF